MTFLEISVCNFATQCKPEKYDIPLGMQPAWFPTIPDLGDDGHTAEIGVQDKVLPADTVGATAF